ncbi:hypothetical protein CPLU01_03517 [Colletotrichum plurivorum]|uniref:LrgB-like protein n=1 Tax=Colletotrichum plurivorum TaxID=2175906 RepID=A0A8H6KT96_9PEZI|nr:hypothetical protein CPLU01_03517 [Colletotrichum plurivorum]
MISNVVARFGLLALRVFHCLRHSTDHVLQSSHRFLLRMSSRGDDNNTSCAWRDYGRPVLERVGHILWVAVIYLFSQLLIWALNLALSESHTEFLSSILGMVLTWVVMVALQQMCPGSDGFYRRNIKSKVDFINNNLGLAFPVPIVAISKSELLGGGGIGRVIATFINTNVIFWTLAFLLSWGILEGVLRRGGNGCWGRWRRKANPEEPWQPSDGSTPRLDLPPQTASRRPSESTTLNGTTITGYHTDKEAGMVPDSRTVSAYFTDSDCPTPIPPPPGAAPEAQPRLSGSSQASGRQPSTGFSWTRECYPIVLAIFFLVVVGIPVSCTTGDYRIVDGCMLWLTWISSTRGQRIFGRSSLLVDRPGLKTTATTLLNPVLLTTLVMMAYIRAKAVASGTSLEETTGMFKGFQRLANIWTDLTLYRSDPIPEMYTWFGAGDAALSLLECGIVVWGFKLYECRQQIWSRAGIVVLLMSVAMAAMNVFVSVLLAGAVGLGAPEAFAFAARSTTLALARPAMDALLGNEIVNAALVVSNGILGQLAYPFLLRKLGIEGRGDADEETEKPDDSAITIAAGTAIGINGAAMGVSYLYERKSRAAPYAVLSMTMFGVMTVVFTAVDPFTKALRGLPFWELSSPVTSLFDD